MRKIVLVANTKGGVGKTTLAQHFLLPALGKAIYVDTDAYANSLREDIDKLTEKAKRIANKELTEFAGLDVLNYSFEELRVNF